MNVVRVNFFRDEVGKVIAVKAYFRQGSYGNKTQDESSHGMPSLKLLILPRKYFLLLFDENVGKRDKCDLPFYDTKPQHCEMSKIRFDY